MLIGLFLRHIKAYKGIKFIPVGEKYNFTSYIGENGSGKSSILEALDSFFNNKDYLINKNAMQDGIFTTNNNPFILPVFLIDKSKINKRKKEFEKISSFFWSIEKKDVSPGIQGSMKNFFELREKIITKKETHYLILIGETNLTAGRKISFGSFHGEENFLLYFLGKDRQEIVTDNPDNKVKIDELRQELEKTLDKVDWKRFLQELKDLYSYVYLPVELEVEKFTKIETTEMQKIFDKKLTDEIGTALDDIKLEGATGINRKLDSFISEIEKTLNNEYCYETGVQRGNSITKSDLVEKIIESYFQKRILNKKEGIIKKRVSELSAGEKRQALVNLVYAFLVREKEREKMIIIGIDEPENSLHTSLCYEQFEKLREISENNQVLITTHWYGFLPIISQGWGHFLSSNDSGEINFETYDLYDYKSKIKKDIETSKNKIPDNFLLKSTNDLVQSIFYSLNSNKPYNWLIVEGISEKIYFEYFFSEEIKNKKLRILPLGAQKKVSELYEYLELPIKNESKNTDGKVYCLIDTDQQEHKKHIGDGYVNLKIRRLCNKNSNIKTELITLNSGDNSVTDIEQSLNPIFFQKTMAELTNEDKYKITDIEDKNGNSHFLKNFKNLELENYFKENDGENKILFAEKYVELMRKNKKTGSFIPEWVKEIKAFF